MPTYPHMCRSDHIEIGHADSEHEHCPLCRCVATLATALDVVEGLIRQHHPNAVHQMNEKLTTLRAEWGITRDDEFPFIDAEDVLIATGLMRPHARLIEPRTFAVGPADIIE